MSPILDSIGSVKAYGWGSASLEGNFSSIASVLIGSGGQTNVTFSSIPNIYDHLHLRLFVGNRNTGTGVEGSYLYLNGDTTQSNYTNWLLRTYRSGAYSGYESDGGFFAQFPQTGTNRPLSAGYVDILDYRNTNKYKTWRTVVGYDTNGGENYLDVRGGLWKNTNAITSFTIGGEFRQYSRFSLYGIKGPA